MLHPTFVTARPVPLIPVLAELAPDRSWSVAERDEFGALDGAPGLFRVPGEPCGLAAHEDLGHARCAWVAREDLL